MHIQKQVCENRENRALTINRACIFLYSVPMKKKAFAIPKFTRKNLNCFLLQQLMEDIINMGREAFFSELDPPLDTFHLANSSGQIIDADSENWTLGKYFEENGSAKSAQALHSV